MRLPAISDDEIIHLTRAIFPTIAAHERERAARLRDGLYYGRGYLLCRAHGRSHDAALAELMPLVAVYGDLTPGLEIDTGTAPVGNDEIIDLAQAVVNAYAEYTIERDDEGLTRDGVYYLRNYLVHRGPRGLHGRAIRDVQRDIATDFGRPDPFPPEPGLPAGEPGTWRPLVGQIRPFGPRGLTDAVGPFLAVTLSRFYLMRAYADDPDRVKRELDADAAVGYCPRVLAEVGTLDGSGFWDQAGFSATDPRWEATIAGLTREAAARGIRIFWTVIGKSRETASSGARRQVVERAARVLRDVAEGVLAVEMVNEAAAGWSGPSPDELLELCAAFTAASGAAFLVGSSAVWTDQNWNTDNPEYAGATAMSPGGWRRTQWRGRPDAIGIAHLDRDTSRGEGRDRPWRQAWDVGLEGDRWCDNEAIGPGASVRSEARADVLRSHRLVSFIARAAISCLHGEPGVRGLRPWDGEPAYAHAWKARRVLDPAAVNGWQHNANARFPERPFTLAGAFTRAETDNRNGIVRCYTLQGPDGTYWTVPFGPVSAFELEAARPLQVECYQQDTSPYPLWARDVARGERLRFEPGACDWLLKGTRK